MSRFAPSRKRRPRGFSIIELLVAVAIALVLTLAITLMMIRHDGDKRALTSTNDAQLNAAYVSFLLDRHLRSAGSGFTQGWQSNFGCLLHAARGGAQVLPRTGAFPAPFATVPNQVRLAPLIIHAGAGAGGTDVLAIATGASGLGEASLRVQPGSSTATGLRIPATVGLRGDDLLLVAESGLGCMVQQLASPFTGGATQQLTFGGTYAAATVNSLNLTSFSAGGTAFVSPLGNRSGSLPSLQLVGIGANDTLFSYDLLRLSGIDSAQPLAEGVSDLRARYGVDSNADGIVDTWVAPTATGYTAAELGDGSDVARQRLMTIMAVRVGMVVRTDRLERENVAPASITLFADLPAGLRVTISLSADEQRMRHRPFELTVPLRNVMHAARS